jgi:hypothetical protein
MKRCFRYTLAGALFVFLAGSPLRAAERTVDPARARIDPAESTAWYDARELAVEGKGWNDTKAFFDRLPSRAEGVVRPPVWGLSRQSAGISVGFVTSAPQIRVRWTVTSKNLAMPHMAATGVSGVDLYVKTPEGKWRWLAVGQPKQTPTNTATLVKALPGDSPREYRLYLPLYNGVSALEVGIPRDQSIATPAPRPASRQKPIVFYGTSITQGGCASRPGMVHTSILGRRLDRPVINLGFSGNGKMEPEMAALLAELDPAAYVLDCLPNMNPKEVEERVEPFVVTLHAAHPGTLIVLAEDRNYTDAFLVSDRAERNKANHAALHAAADRLKARGINNFLMLPATVQLGDDGEATVDGSHPTDLGFMRMADAFRFLHVVNLRGRTKLPPGRRSNP